MFTNTQNTSNSDNMTDFVALVKTKYDKEDLIREIDLVLQSIYLTNKKTLDGALERNIRSEVSQLIERARAQEKNFQGFLKALRQILVELKEIELIIAVDPTEEMINQIYSWIRTNLKTSLVINFTKNPDLVGGAQIAYKGKYFEYSLKKELDQIHQIDQLKPDDTR